MKLIQVNHNKLRGENVEILVDNWIDPYKLHCG
jgi:hypothetical protein